MAAHSLQRVRATVISKNTYTSTAFFLLRSNKIRKKERAKAYNYKGTLMK